jgi:broad specificity phosphatase PhoE
MTAKTVARVRPVVVAVGADLSALAVCHKVFLRAIYQVLGMAARRTQNEVHLLG